MGRKFTGMLRLLTVVARKVKGGKGSRAQKRSRREI